MDLIDFNSFYEYLINQGYYFDDKIIEDYLLSIKSNPFVLLTGQPGSGKSTLPILFSEYLSCNGRKSEIILNSTNSLGKSFSNKEWHLKREVISEILPILPFEGKECLFTVNDSFKSVGKFKIDPRFKFTDKRLINHLKRLHEEDPNQYVDLKIKVADNPINASYLKIDDFNKDWNVFKNFNSEDNNISSDIANFLNNSKKDLTCNHFIIIENITKDDENSLINFFNYLHDEFNLSKHNNLFITCLANIDGYNINFSNSFIDHVNVIEINPDISRYLRPSSTVPTFGDIDYLEYGSEVIMNLSIPEMKSIFQEIWCNDSDLWSLISHELTNFNDIFKKEGLNISFRSLIDILRFLLVSWKYEGKKYNWENWEKYFDVQIKQKLLPKISKTPINPNFFVDLYKCCLKMEDGGISAENIKYYSSYLKIKNMECSLNLENFSFFNCYTFTNQLSEIENTVQKISKDKKTSDNNMSKYGSNIYKYGEYFTINKQINRKHINFGKFDSLEDATFVKNILVENDWVLSRIKNNDCIYRNDDSYWIIKSFKNKLHILGKFTSYNDAKDHVNWLTDEFKNNENFVMYIPKSIDFSNSKNLDEIITEMKGWEKLVFNAINEIESTVFSLYDLKRLDIFKMYQFKDESLDSTIVENLNKLSDLKLIMILSNNYYKKVF